MPAVGERFENPQAALASRVEHAAGRFVALQRLAQANSALLAAACRPLGIAQALLDDAAMRIGVLTDVERGEMEAKGAHAADEPPHLEQTGVLAFVGAQTVGD